MSSFWSGTVKDFLCTSAHEITGKLAIAQIRHFRLNEAQQLRAWQATIGLLTRAFTQLPEAAEWRVLLEYPMLRLGHRPDVIVLTRYAILVLEIKAGAKAYSAADRRQVEDYALDLHYFHAASRDHPILPILVAEDAPISPGHLQLIMSHNVAAPLDANAHTLPKLLRDLARQAAHVARPLDAEVWLCAPYRPVPTIVEAACMLYAKHGVAEIRASRSDAINLRATTDTILAEIAQARNDSNRLILFVTGIPGSGKTLCGLNVIFGAEEAARGSYLTGNPTLVHVLREALTRDAVACGARRGDAGRKFLSAIQALPKFRDQYVTYPEEVPAERIVVIDEAQRCWSAEWAIAKTRDKPVPLTRSEPAHLLEIMSRHDGFAAIVCLVGGGQEIHTGEGGLAEWGGALRRAVLEGQAWRVRVAPDLLGTADSRQSLGAVAGLRPVDALHLSIPVRQVRNIAAITWVEQVLVGDVGAAARTAHEANGLPFLLTREAAIMRQWLRLNARGLRRAGLLASSGGARLRAEGFGAELPHLDPKAVAHWFLDRYPDDVRASDALEVLATEFSCQGLELDYVGLCWDADLVRESGGIGWRARSFRGTRWHNVHQPEAVANQINTYRVLLTRARYETVIFVPRGDEDDRTRPPAIYDAVANFLLACGVQKLECVSMPQTMPAPERLLV